MKVMSDRDYLVILLLELTSEMNFLLFQALLVSSLQLAQLRSMSAQRPLDFSKKKMVQNTFAPVHDLLHLTLETADGLIFDLLCLLVHPPLPLQTVGGLAYL